jgi:CBS domain-containing protein
VLVVHDHALYGLVTDRDLAVRAVAEARQANAPVGPLSSGNLIGVDVDATTGEAARLMRAHGVRRLPVIENGQVAGVVTVSDLVLDDLVFPDGLPAALAGLSRPTANV